MIDWEDHSGDGGWVDDAPTDDKICVARTIGWLWKETDKAYHVINTQTINDDGQGGLSTILKSCVVGSKILRKSL
jgi:hypothetical protein